MDAKESSEDYLEAILILSDDKKVVRNIDIAKHLEFSKPSVSIALRKLKEKHQRIIYKSFDYLLKF